MSNKKGNQNHEHHLTLEITVLSAQSLKNPSSLFSRRLRPYVTLSTTNTATTLYRTRVDEHDGGNPTWGDTVRVPVDPSFLRDNAGSSAVHLFVLSKRRLAGPARLGWCRIPSSDVVDGLRPPGTSRRLSYALRNCRHGGRGHGVVDLAVRVVGPAVCSYSPQAAASEMVMPDRQLPPSLVLGVLPDPGWVDQVAIGIPVAAFGLPEAGEGRKARGGVVAGDCVERGGLNRRHVDCWLGN